MGLVSRLKRQLSAETKSRIKSAIADVAFRDIGARNGACIIMYHGIDAHERTTFNKRFFSASTFATHLAFFKENFDVVPLSEFYNPTRPSHRFRIAITFDDGYENNVTRAMPLLEAFDLPATFFVTGMANREPRILWSDFVDIARARTSAPIEVRGVRYEKDARSVYRDGSGRELTDLIRKDGGFELKQEVIDAFLPHTGDFREEPDLRDYCRLMNDDQIQRAARSPSIEIGSHGFFHNNLGSLSVDDATAEVQLSKDYLEGLIQEPIVSIAYPDGSYSRGLVDNVEKMGFRHQLAVNYLHGADSTDRRLHNRYGLYPEPGSVKYLAHRITRA